MRNCQVVGWTLESAVSVKIWVINVNVSSLVQVSKLQPFRIYLAHIYCG